MLHVGLTKTTFRQPRCPRRKVLFLGVWDQSFLFAMKINSSSRITSFEYHYTLGTNQANILANRRNIVTETMGLIFIMVCDNIIKPCYCTSEPTEHTFVGWRGEKRAATVLECTEIEDKRSRNVNAIYERNLAVSDPIVRLSNYLAKVCECWNG